MASAVSNEPGRPSDWLLYEEDGIGRYSRENVEVAAGQTLKTGSVVGYLDASTQVAEYDPGAQNGMTAFGIIVADVKTDSAPAMAAVVARHARINPNHLVWKTGLGPSDKATALADLAAKGIVVVSEA